MKRLFVFATIALCAVALSSCNKENTQEGKTPLVLGLENWSPADNSEVADTKTYMYNGNTSNPEIHWYNTGCDKVVWVFQASNGKKRKYVSTATDDSATRAFVPDSGVPDLVAEHDIKYVLWAGGGSPSSDNTSLSGDVLVSGGTLCVPNPQTLNKSQSFQATNANVTVAKPSDTYMKNVMGYIRFVNAAGPTGKATIKSLEFQADEYLAGQINIDYSGSEPVGTIVDNENASNSLVVNARLLNGTSYEAGTWYACLLPGTYHNFKIIVTAFETEGNASDAATKTPFTLNCGTVTITRSKWNNAGTIPTSDPYATVWPENTDAFDYGISYPDTKVATLDHDALEDKGWASTKSGSPGAKSTEEITMDKVTYGIDSQFVTMGGSRPYINTCYNWSSPLGNTQAPVPTRRYFSFKINKPGTLSFFPRYSNSSAEATLRVILDKTAGGVRTLSYLYNAVPAERTQSAPTNDNRATYTITVPVTASDLAGIDDAATIYVAFASVSAAVHYYDITWAPADL